MTMCIVFNKCQRKLKGQSRIYYRRNMIMILIAKFRHFFLVKRDVIAYFCKYFVVCSYQGLWLSRAQLPKGSHFIPCLWSLRSGPGPLIVEWIEGIPVLLKLIEERKFGNKSECSTFYDKIVFE